MEQFLMIAPPKAPTQLVMEPVQQMQEEKPEKPSMNGTNAMDLLPDDIIGLCLVNLTAKDLVHMEMLSKRLRELVLMNNRLWRDKVRSRWGNQANSTLLESSAAYAGGWKNLYAEKHLSEKKFKPWVIPAKSEVDAMLEVIRGRPSTADHAMPSDGPVPAKRQLTILLLLDGSSSVTREDFDSMKEFSRTLVYNLRDNGTDAGVGVIQFNQSPRTILPITAVAEETIIQRLDKMQQLMGSTDIAAPIRSSYELLREDGNIGGDAVVLLLSDGQTSTTELEASQREARRAAEEMGVRLFAFGVGRDVDEMGLHRIASSTRIEAVKKDDGTVVLEKPGGSYFTLRRMERSML